MEWISDPTAWLGLGTLVVLEIVLGIDNLVFIAILTDRLPPEQRHRARLTGLSLALGMRLVLLASISWIMGLNETLFSVFTTNFSGRDVVLLIGGAFLIFKATVELHERLEGGHDAKGAGVAAPLFWQVIAQIVVLDAVFSIDAVITAVGMARHLPVMMLAVIIAVGFMILASRPLMDFVGQHPTVIILCLGFLLMIGFSLVAEGAGFHIPKEYLYAAIGFSVLIESFNQVALHNRQRLVSMGNLRRRTAGAVLRLLGGSTGVTSDDLAALASARADRGMLFGVEERTMIQGVLRLGERSVQTVMTPRRSVVWIDLSNDSAKTMNDIRNSSHSRLLVIRDGKLDEPLGILQKKDLADALIDGKKPDLETLLVHPLAILETANVLQALETFRKEGRHEALVVSEYGIFEGILTLTDIVEAITGDLPEGHEKPEVHIEPCEGGSWLVDGLTALGELADALNIEVDSTLEAHTAAGLALNTLKRIPVAGDTFTIGAWSVEVIAMDGNRIAHLRFSPTAP